MTIEKQRKKIKIIKNLIYFSVNHKSAIVAFAILSIFVYVY